MNPRGCDDWCSADVRARIGDSRISKRAARVQVNARERSTFSTHAPRSRVKQWYINFQSALSQHCSIAAVCCAAVLRLPVFSVACNLNNDCVSTHPLFLSAEIFVHGQPMLQGIKYK